MKRIIVICEGPTEQEFCNTILVPHFLSYGINIQAPLIKHSHGGIVPWSNLLQQIIIHLKSERDAYVTTLIDYYGINETHHFPHWEESGTITDINEKIDYLEDSMKQSVDERIRHRFLPYIQLHEFESILFSSVEAFHRVIPKEDLVGLDELRQISDRFDNPELINNSKETSPSHRLARIIKGYNKIVYGNYLAEDIGLPTIRQHCPRFNRWITTLQQIKPI